MKYSFVIPYEGDEALHFADISKIVGENVHKGNCKRADEPLDKQAHQARYVYEITPRD